MLLSKLQLGTTIALVSDAGTPVISDPGYDLVCACYSYNIRVIPLPGPCSVITALSASGLPIDRFCFEGFLPVKKNARINYFRTLLYETRTLIFYDSKYRILNTLEDMVDVLGAERRVVLARELTKIWESIYRASLQELLFLVRTKKICVQGEIILIVEGYRVNRNELRPEIKNIIRLLSKELPFRKVVNLIVDIYGISKNVVYSFLLGKDI